MSRKNKNFLRATQATIYIVEAFAKLRELSQTLINITQTTEEEKHKQLLTKSGNLLNELLFDNLQKVSADCSVEFNLGLMKIKHHVRSMGNYKKQGRAFISN